MKVPFHPGPPRPIPSPAQSNPGPLSRWRYHLPGPPPTPPPPPGTHLHYHRSANNFFNGPPMVRPWIPSGRLPQKRPPQSGYMPHSANFPTGK